MSDGAFAAAFGRGISVLAMLHLKGDHPDDRLARAEREIDLLWQDGVDSLIVENYFGDTVDVIAVLDYLVAGRPDVRFGLNILGDDWLAFNLAADYGAQFVQLDSVAGHLAPDDDAAFAARLARARKKAGCLVLGGVRFKYQPYRSGRSLHADLTLAVTRCDAIVVTGTGTGIATPVEKVAEFRRIVGPEFPLIVGAGVTADNAGVQLRFADAVIVGSTLKDTRMDTGDVAAENVAIFIDAVRSVNRA